MVDDNDDIDAAAIQSLVEIAQLNPTQARNALKHYGNSLENACNAFFNGSLQFTENDAIKLHDDIGNKWAIIAQKLPGRFNML